MNQAPHEKTLDVLKKHGFRFKKKLGQNFILDRNLLKKIVAGAEISPGDGVVEIGPGAGTLTRELAECGAQVLAIEIDNTLIPILQESITDCNVKIIQGDAMRLNLDELTLVNNIKQPYKIVANLPYYITSPLIMKILEEGYNCQSITVMVQWEVAQRLTAQPGQKDYGAITLAVNYYTEPKIMFKVSRNLFTPVPEVDSAVLFLKKRDQPPVSVYNTQLMFKIIKAAFGQRRKTLANALVSMEGNLSKDFVINILEWASIDGKRRGETLSLDEYALLANVWHASQI